MTTIIGQWRGPLSGGSDGLAMLCIERVEGQLQGRIVIVEGEPRYVYSMFVSVGSDTSVSDATATLESLLNFEFNRLEPIHKHIERAQELKLPNRVDIKLSLSPDGRSLQAEWNTSLGNSGSAQLTSLVAPEWSDKLPNVMPWDEFRKEAQHLDRHSWVFRGQTAPWSLRTSFHRRGRYDLIRYGHDDISAMQRVFVATTNQWLQISDPVQHASLIALGQHHGYPTPLLDWTRSPYIAAYFAVRDPTPVGALGGPRVHAFNARQWRQIGYQTNNLTDPRPTLTVMDAVPFWNPRAAQQQSVTTMTNIDHIERYIEEISTSAPVIRYFDFDANERERILDELEWMGVTESLLFPGMEGSFRTLARSRFPK